ncbi:ParA family protein [Sphingobacterium sp. MYb388]|uniref:ParA family protein n=1 Tax=Sphingobacterium sp. MYb388 TaxID=2745437 RepID=UPI0030ABC7CF
MTSIRIYVNFMAKIITIAHQKGGVGKSTLALNLAYSFGRNVRTALTDTDPQGSIVQLQEIATGIDILPYERHTLQSDYDVIFVDTPPYIIETMRPIFLQSDLVIIPTKAGVPDIMAIRATIDLVKEVQQEKKYLKACIVLNMVKSRANITEQAREQLQVYDLPILAEIKDRVSYTNTFLTGGIHAGNDEAAKQEVEELTKQILELL